LREYVLPINHLTLAFLFAVLFSAGAFAGAQNTVERMDKNGDGLIQEEEARGRIQKYFSAYDCNSDRKVSAQEIIDFNRGSGCSDQKSGSFSEHSSPSNKARLIRKSLPISRFYFKIFDCDQSGKIDSRDGILANKNECGSKSRAISVVNRQDRNRNLVIDRSEARGRIGLEWSSYDCDRNNFVTIQEIVNQNRGLCVTRENFREALGIPARKIDASQCGLGGHIFSDDGKQYQSIMYPEGNGPFPILIISHGRGGLRGNHFEWAKLATQLGFAVMLLDHYSPRNFHIYECREILESLDEESFSVKWREADVVPALRKIASDPKIDKDKVVVWGFSGGAAFVLPFLTKKELMEEKRIAAAILFYPARFLCSNSDNYAYDTGAYAAAGSPPSLAVFIGKEDIAWECWDESRTYFNSRSVQTLTEYAYENTRHQFDQEALTDPQLKKRVGDNSAYSRKAHMHSIAKVKEFLNSVLRQ